MHIYIYIYIYIFKIKNKHHSTFRLLPSSRRYPVSFLKIVHLDYIQNRSQYVDAFMSLHWRNTTLSI